MSLSKYVLLYIKNWLQKTLRCFSYQRLLKVKNVRSNIIVKQIIILGIKTEMARQNDIADREKFNGRPEAERKKYLSVVKLAC